MASSLLSSTFGIGQRLLKVERIGIVHLQQIRTATKKAGGSTNNGRDSAGRRLGVKIMPNRPTRAGSIIVRQRGAKYKAGDNVGMGKDHTIFSKIEGVVTFKKVEFPLRKRKNKVMSQVNVYPFGDGRVHPIAQRLTQSSLV